MSKFGTTAFTWPGGTVYTSRIGGANPVDFEVDTPVINYYSEGVKRVAKPSFEKWDRCFQCGFTYPKGKFVYYQGRPYCIPGRCFGDIKQLKRRNLGNQNNRRPDTHSHD